MEVDVVLRLAADAQARPDAVERGGHGAGAVGQLLAGGATGLVARPYVGRVRCTTATGSEAVERP